MPRTSVGIVPPIELVERGFPQDFVETRDGRVGEDLRERILCRGDLEVEDRRDRFVL